MSAAPGGPGRDTSGAPGQRLEGPGYPRVSRLFHWSMAALVLITVPVGVAMTSEGFRGVSDALYVTHKALGVVILLVLVLRLLWRWIAPPPPLPETIPPVERRLAVATHRLLYVLLLIMAVTGYVRTVGGGFPVELLDSLGIPPLVPEMPALARALSVVHQFTSYVLVAVVALHLGAVVQHTFIAPNHVLWRMWPPWAGASGDASAPGPDREDL